ncbi:hypothetical protein HYH03_011151 [Edaphochlamys debaryana]|uniref:sphinganine-1-phosphate aldolase n=1 Tax=Edaphochlamys debaryana TaxID=47281 RepID=A0A835XV34_9CHLO|nr:hypothetical protein HYH03_011151 [Edaphochlamys debaryana]|eukprot:KAG2490349.1 hypothetical protein HYH03_011151 [Edaphochlamys debaryana]
MEHLQALGATARGLLARAAEHLPPELVEKASGYAQNAYAEVEPYVGTVVVEARARFLALRETINSSLDGLDAATIIAGTCVACLLLYLALRLLAWAVRPFRERGLLPVFFDALRRLPPVAAMLAREKAKLKAQLLASREAQAAAAPEHLPGMVLGAPVPSAAPARLLALPARSTPPGVVLTWLQQRASKDVQFHGDGTSTLSGAVYMPALSPHRALLDDAYRLFALANPLHADAFPSVRQMEAEVVAMTAGLLGGGEKGANPQVCGAMTSGGTESILMAVKASRDYVCAKKGIREPEMIIGVSAHAAYWKAAEYFRIKLHVVPVGADFRLSPAAVRRRMGPNTVLVVASAPGFPHGLVDDVQGIAGLALRAGVCCHVDGCLGGFCLPFATRLGAAVPPFDFSVPGVTSMSVDAHKFGMAHKGTSVVLYGSPEIRQHQYTRVTDWSGGLYISPGLAGSRPGALIATAWAALVAVGEEGLLAATGAILSARDTLVKGIRETIPELQVIGEPEMGVVAFRPNPRWRRPRGQPPLNIYLLNDWLTAHGWHLNALQKPPALHFCFTAMNARSSAPLVAALRQGVTEVLAAAAAAKGRGGGGKGDGGGSAPVYGMANSAPDRGMVGEFLVAYQDVMLTP